MKKYFSYSVLLMAFMLGSSGFCMDAPEENDSSSKRITLKLKDGITFSVLEEIARNTGLTNLEKRRFGNFYKASTVLDPSSVLRELKRRSEIEDASIDTPVAGKLLSTY